MTTRILKLGAVALAASLAFTACATAPRHSTDQDSSAPRAVAELSNDADAVFAATMLAQYRQTIAMADLVLARESAVTPDIAALARNVKEVQTAELDIVVGWLDKWNARAIAGLQHTRDGYDGPEVVRTAADGDLGRVFLEQLIEGHQRSVDTAGDEMAAGSSPEAVQLARSILANRNAEIGTMRALLGR